MPARSAGAQPRAWSRSASRSSAVSMPTESRTRSGRDLERGAGHRGVRHPARVLDQRLDAAQRLPQREHLGAVAHRQRLLLAAGHPERHHAAEPPHLPCRDLVARGARPGPGSRPRRRPGARSGTRRPARRCRSAAPSAAPGSSARAGPARRRTARRPRPSRSGGSASRSARSRSRTTSAPPTTSEWPPQYLVVECTTTSAPRVSGCWRYGEAKVLSTTSSAPASWAIAGQRLDVGDVEQRVGRRLDPDHLGLPGRIAARTASRSATGGRRVLEAPRSGDLVEQPERAAVRVVGDDHVVAGPADARSSVSSAASPLANAKPRSPSSSARGCPRARCGSGCRSGEYS